MEVREGVCNFNIQYIGVGKYKFFSLHIKVLHSLRENNKERSREPKIHTKFHSNKVSENSFVCIKRRMFK